MEYQEMELLKQSDKSTVYLVREKESGQMWVCKVLQGNHPVYLELLECRHPYLPRLYSVNMTDETTEVIEEYIEGESLQSGISLKEVFLIIRELCAVLEFLHGKGIIHRDIKPSNLLMANDGHIRLIDFDAARLYKENLEQDTRLLGTRGYAPPEQYGFAQTDERTDIYALGVTIRQLMGKTGQKPHYQRIIAKCTNLNPDKRYRSVSQVKRAFFSRKRNLCIAVAVFGIALAVLPGIAYWRNVADADVLKCIRMLTFLPLEEIDKMDKWEGSQLNTAKEILAWELTKLVHGQEEAEKAQTAAKALFGGQGSLENMPSHCLKEEDFIDGRIDILAVLQKSGLAPSRAEARRNVEQGGVSIDGEQMKDIKKTFTKEDFFGDGIIVKRGKKNFMKVSL